MPLKYYTPQRLGDNSWQEVPLLARWVKSLTVGLAGSGAVTDLFFADAADCRDGEVPPPVAPPVAPALHVEKGPPERLELPRRELPGLPAGTELGRR